jgi:hypothetical protein
MELRLKTPIGPCTRCGLTIWAEDDSHECPAPFPYKTAKYLLDFHVASRIPVSPRMKARIKLGLNSDPRIEGM